MGATAEPAPCCRAASPHPYGAATWITAGNLHISWGWNGLGLGPVVLARAVNIEQHSCFAIEIGAVTALHQ